MDPYKASHVSRPCCVLYIRGRWLSAVLAQKYSVCLECNDVLCNKTPEAIRMITVRFMHMYLCMYVCMYVCMCVYVCIYVCIHMRLYVWVYVCMHDCRYVHVCLYVCTCVCMHVYVSMFVCMHACMYAYACMVYVYMYASTCMHICMYVSIHIRMYRTITFGSGIQGWRFICTGAQGSKG